MKRVKALKFGGHQVLLLAGLVIISVDSQAADVTLSTGRGINDRISAGPISNGGEISLRNGQTYGNGESINISQPGIINLSPRLVIQPPAASTPNSPTSSTSVNGQLNYSNGLGTGTFRENDSSPTGAKVAVDLQRKGSGYVAEASSKTGFAQSYVETKWVPASGNISGSSTAEATSSWSDWFVISGGTGVGTASFTSLLDGVLASGKNGSASLNVNIGYTPKTSCFTLCGEADMNQTLFNQISSISGKSKSTIEQTLEGEFTFAYNKPFALTVMLGVQSMNGGMADFTLGALGNNLLLPQGAGLYTASGLDYVQAVPEAETYAMMLAGLGLVGWAARRRQASLK